MKKSIVKIKVALLLLIIGCSVSCTHNNGDVGPLFGKWKLSAIEIDGVDDKNYKGNLFFNFQSDVTSMIIVWENHDSDQKYGHWTLNGDDFTIMYDDTNYTPFPESYFNAGVNKFTLSTLDSKELVFWRVVNGHKYIYKCVKW